MTSTDGSLPKFLGMPMKAISLLLLVLQTVGVVFAIRVSKSQSQRPKYLNSTTVFCAEVIKFGVSLLLLVHECKSIQGAVSLLRSRMLDMSSWVRTSMPCVLYTIQNNLLFLALSNLPGAEYQVAYQLKILTTAFLSTLILGKALSALKWFSLAILTVGVALIEWHPNDEHHMHGSRTIGLGAVLAACFTSGLGGVLMEKLMKSKGVSMWLTNVQVAAISMVSALVMILMADGSEIQQRGFFQGYYYLVWIVILLQAVGGLVVASVMKYADNILKCFGNALSISIGCVMSSIILQEFTATLSFFVGTVLVLLAISLYSIPEQTSLAFWNLKLQKSA